MKYYAKVVTFDAGTEFNKQYAMSNLKLGEKYEMNDLIIGSWCTDVYLKGFEQPFNSVYFEFADEDGVAYDLLDVPIATNLYKWN